MDTFKILHHDSGSNARRGLLATPNGTIETPVFMPVGTAGAVKGITPHHLKDTGTTIILANTYHLLSRPGVDAVEKLGGLHKFMAWNGPILTDSGGYQIFSLSHKSPRSYNGEPHVVHRPLAKIGDSGVEFASHIDGAKIRLTPQTATKIQNRLGADIIMCLDQCPPFPCDAPLLETAVKRTIRWASICKKAHTNPNQLLFGIVQGGINPALREQCASELVKMDFDGYAIGGLGVGEGYDNLLDITARTALLLPQDKPHYLMGVGTPADIIAAVRAGVDMFDCVLPTRNGRNAFAFTKTGPAHLRNAANADSAAPIETGCDCYCCTNFTRGSVRHFFNVGEMLGPILVSIHNIRFYQRLMTEIRQAIENNDFSAWATDALKTLP